VTLCKKKDKLIRSLSNNNGEEEEEDLFAIKRYSEHVLRESYFKQEPSLRFDQVAINEFAFTRQLRMCSNIIQIQRLYAEVEYDDVGATVTFYIVMEYARHGTLF